MKIEITPAGRMAIDIAKHDAKARGESKTDAVYALGVNHGLHKAIAVCKTITGGENHYGVEACIAALKDAL